MENIKFCAFRLSKDCDREKHQQTPSTSPSCNYRRIIKFTNEQMNWRNNFYLEIPEYMWWRVDNNGKIWFNNGN
jgi:hypothetical protein